MSNVRKSRQASAMNGAQAAGGAPEQTSAAEEPLAFEEALGRLDEMVAALESSQLPLEDALKLFEEGVRMTQRCQEMLDAAALRVQRLRMAVSDEDDQPLGNGFVLETFEIDGE